MNTYPKSYMYKTNAKHTQTHPHNDNKNTLTHTNTSTHTHTRTNLATQIYTGIPKNTGTTKKYTMNKGKKLISTFTLLIESVI